MHTNPVNLNCPHVDKILEAHEGFRILVDSLWVYSHLLYHRFDTIEKISTMPSTTGVLIPFCFTFSLENGQLIVRIRTRNIDGLVLWPSNILHWVDALDAFLLPFFLALLICFLRTPFSKDVENEAFPTFSAKCQQSPNLPWNRQANWLALYPAQIRNRLGCNLE